MKKISGLFFVLIFFAASLNMAVAGERMVQLNIPGCSAWGSKSRIGTVLKEMKGVKKFDFEKKDFVIITFDDEMTTLEIIIHELDKKGNKIKNKPVYLK